MPDDLGEAFSHTETDCRTCNNTGFVACVDYDGSGYGQACPDCERIPSSAGEPDATDTEAAMVARRWTDNRSSVK